MHPHGSRKKISTLGKDFYKFEEDCPVMFVKV